MNGCHGHSCAGACHVQIVCCAPVIPVYDWNADSGTVYADGKMSPTHMGCQIGCPVNVYCPLKPRTCPTSGGVEMFTSGHVANAAAGPCGPSGTAKCICHCGL